MEYTITIQPIDFKLTVDEKTTVLDVKNQINVINMMPVEFQTLTGSKGELRNCRTLSSYKCAEGTVLNYSASPIFRIALFS